jgi:hypothetical protein
MDMDMNSIDVLRPSNGRQRNDRTAATAEQRLTLLANGYTPLPNLGKMTLLKGWPKVTVTPEVIAHWSRRRARWPDTGLRVDNGLAVIDLDIDHELTPELVAALDERFDKLSSALLRAGKGQKVALFCRTAEPFSRTNSRRFTAPGETVEEHGTHQIEIFGGGSPRQFGAFGAHTRDAVGDVVIAYSWPGGSPLTVPLAELPEFTEIELSALIDFVEKWITAHGFAPVTHAKKGESWARHVYDLTDELVFETNEDEDGVPLTTIRERARRGDVGLRVSASFIEPGRLHSRTRCLVGRSRSGALTIWDSATGITHMEAELKPVELDMAKVSAKFEMIREAGNV